MECFPKSYAEFAKLISNNLYFPKHLYSLKLKGGSLFSG